MLGDFNINLLELDSLSHEYLCNFLDKGYIPGFSGITRPSIGNFKGSCVDNVFIKNKDLKTETYKLKNSLTDHYPLFIAINKIKTDTKDSHITLNYNKLKNTAATIYYMLYICYHKLYYVSTRSKCSNRPINK